MGVTIPHTLVADNEALASDVNDNFNALAAKFTSGPGGIADDDVAGPFSGTKISNVAGKRVPSDRIEDNAVTDAKLSSSASVDASRAVGTNHIKDANVTRAKLVAAAVALAQTGIQVVSFPWTLANNAGAAAHWLEATTTVVGGVNCITAKVHTNWQAGAVWQHNSGVVPPTTSVAAASNTVLGMWLSGIGTNSGTLNIAYIPNA